MQETPLLLRDDAKNARSEIGYFTGSGSVAQVALLLFRFTPIIRWQPGKGDHVPVGTAFHERTKALCESLNYREWSGYYTVSVYETHHEHEYNAIRNAAALIDISPLFKYLITGKHATRFVNRVITRDINKVQPGQVIYCCWCDEDGKVVDDGTIT